MTKREAVLASMRREPVLGAVLQSLEAAARKQPGHWVAHGSVIVVDVRDVRIFRHPIHARENLAVRFDKTLGRVDVKFANAPIRRPGLLWRLFGCIPRFAVEYTEERHA